MPTRHDSTGSCLAWQKQPKASEASCSGSILWGDAQLTPALLKKLGMKLVHTPLFSQTRKLPRPRQRVFDGVWSGKLPGENIKNQSECSECLDTLGKNAQNFAIALTNWSQDSIIAFPFLCIRMPPDKLWQTSSRFSRCQVAWKSINLRISHFGSLHCYLWSLEESDWCCLSWSTQWCMVRGRWGWVDPAGLVQRIYHLVIWRSHGKSPFLIGKPSINGQFSMAMLNNQRVVPRLFDVMTRCWSLGWRCWTMSAIFEFLRTPIFRTYSWRRTTVASMLVSCRLGDSELSI